MTMEARPRPFPDRGVPVETAVLAFLEFVNTTSVNKLVGLSDDQARATPLQTSPAMSLLGLVKHLTAVLREHIQIHIGEASLPSLCRSDDHEYEFRVLPEETVATIVAAFDTEWDRSKHTLTGIDFSRSITTNGHPNTVGRVLTDVLQKMARHLGHIDILRELIDGLKGE
jgi:hypothetical protein